MSDPNASVAAGVTKTCNCDQDREDPGSIHATKKCEHEDRETGEALNCIEDQEKSLGLVSTKEEARKDGGRDIGAHQNHDINRCLAREVLDLQIKHVVVEASGCPN